MRPVTEEFLRGSRRVRSLGEGTFGTVDLFETPDGPQVIKKTKQEDKSLGYPPDLLNEIDLLVKMKPVESIVDLNYVYLCQDSKRGYLLMEPLDTNLTAWAKTKSFEERVSLLETLIVEIGGALAYLHSFSLLHNDIKTNNILVGTRDGHTCFKLADFGKSYYVTGDDYMYGAIDRHMPPDERDLFGSELWSFMICLVEVIIGGKKMFKNESNAVFYSRYSTFSRRGKFKFDLLKYLKRHLTYEQIKSIPLPFWLYIEPIIKNTNELADEMLSRVGMKLDPQTLRSLSDLMSREVQGQESYAAVETYFKKRFSYLGMPERYGQFKRLINRFLSLVPPITSNDLLKYAEVAMVTVGKRRVKSWSRFKDQGTFLEYQKRFLETLDYQIHTLKR